jgi:hypothetical protein
MDEKSRGWSEAIRLRYASRRETIERPHPFVRIHGSRASTHERKYGADESHDVPFEKVQA